MKLITESPAWQALERHQKTIAHVQMKSWFANDPSRFARYSLDECGILFDYSKNRITDETLKLLIELTHTAQLSQKIEALFAGYSINLTEKRPALHTALRSKDSTPVKVNGENVIPQIMAAREKMRVFTDAVRDGTWRGSTQKPIRDIVNLGIGGSHLGPLMATHALKDFTQDNLRCHFISNIDSAHIQDVLKQIDPETTLFIISSKSFTTLETLTNATTIRAWLANKLGEHNAAQHFVAVTAAAEKAIEFGIASENIFPIWDWVGGRYSIWSAIGLPLALMIGMTHFEEFLQGAYDMDQHFRHADFSKNLPVLLALISIWYINFFNASSYAFVPYSHHLHYFRLHLQQMEMESNGKNVSNAGHEVNYITGPITWGEQGCDGQHAFYQLLHQGPHFIPVDFVLVANGTSDWNHHHDILVASGLSQAQALMQGKSFDEIYSELHKHDISEEEARYLATHKTIPGNRPSNILFLSKITPYHLGALLALYEHKIFVQGAIWDINSFDQWGVELGKQLLPRILNDLQLSNSETQHDASTQGLIAHYKKMKEML